MIIVWFCKQQIANMNDCFLEEAALIRKLSIGELETYLIDKGFTEAAAAKLKGWNNLSLNLKRICFFTDFFGLSYQKMKLMDGAC